MRYSVYDYINKKYLYFEGTGIPPAYGTFREPPSGSLSPESLAVRLPSDARKVGEGLLPQGAIAVDDSRALAAYGSDEGTPWYYMAALFLLGWIAGTYYEKK